MTTTPALSPRTVMDSAVTEAALQEAVVALLELHGWRVFTVRRSAYRGKNGRMVSAVTSEGWPDVLALKGKRIVAWELKVENPNKGRVTPEQQDWLDAWAVTGAVAWIVRPSDWEEIRAFVEAS